MANQFYNPFEEGFQVAFGIGTPIDPRYGGISAYVNSFSDEGEYPMTGYDNYAVSY